MIPGSERFTLLLIIRLRFKLAAGLGEPWCRDGGNRRFKLAAGLGEPWCWDGGIPQGCPLSTVFIVVLYVPWCRRLESVPSIKPQLYADNLKCSSVCPKSSLFGSC